MRISLDAIQGRTFDVAVIGAGINGASAAQHLAAEGYSVLLVDAGDYAGGSTGRSSRLLHCGLRYLAPGRSMWDFVLRPDRLAIAMRMAKLGIDARSQMVKTTPERTVEMTFGFPIYNDGPYAKWQTDLAFRLLWWLGPRDLPLDYVFERPSRTHDLPLLKWLRDDGKLSGVAQFREYRMDWPERLCVGKMRHRLAVAREKSWQWFAVREIESASPGHQEFSAGGRHRVVDGDLRATLREDFGGHQARGAGADHGYIFRRR